jgi:hypothetical protein
MKALTIVRLGFAIQGLMVTDAFLLTWVINTATAHIKVF